MNVERSGAGGPAAALLEGVGGKGRARSVDEPEAAADGGGFASVLMSLGADAGVTDLGEVSPNAGGAKDDGGPVPAAAVADVKLADGALPVVMSSHMPPPWLEPAQLLQNRLSVAGGVVEKNLSQGQGRATAMLTEIARPADSLSAMRQDWVEPGENPVGAGPGKNPSSFQQDAAGVATAMASPIDLASMVRRDVLDSGASQVGVISARTEAAGIRGADAALGLAVQAEQEQMTKPARGPVGLDADVLISPAGKEALRVSVVDAAASQKGRPNNALEEGRANVRLDRFERSVAGPVLAELVSLAGAGDSGARQSERQFEKMNVKSVETGSWGAQALLAGARTDTMTAPVGAPVPPPEVLVAEQVRYWVSNNVQNAELKLDQFGSSPVEVSISLQGNEARVVFRTDIPEVRQLLEGAVLHLKEMLQNEGLVLAGVSVGASGADASAQQEQSARQNARQGVVALPETAALGGRSRAVQGTGQAVDVFV